MKGVKPCPYCGGEVEVVKLPKYESEKKNPYRIQCYACRALVARGEKYPIETELEGKQRIKDYDNYIKQYWSPKRSTKIRQSLGAQRRDREMASRSKTDIYNDESYEMHDANNSHIAKRPRAGWSVL